MQYDGYEWSGFYAEATFKFSSIDEKECELVNKILEIIAKMP